MTTLRALHTTFDGPDLARWVSDRYDVGAVRLCRLWRSGVNDTYEVHADHRYVLRVYRHRWRTTGDINFELAILRHLARAGVKVSVPVPQRSGADIEVVEAPEGERPAVLFTFASGVSRQLSTDGVREYGRAAARLHEATKDFPIDDSRYTIDLDHLITEPLEKMAPFFDDTDTFAYVQNLGDRVRRGLDERVGALEFGVCHGDFHGGNAHVAANNEITMFDFDCGGPGWRAYDVAVFRWSTNMTTGRTGTDDRWYQFLAGYREVRELPEPDLMTVPLFVAARHLWLMGLHAHLAAEMGGAMLEQSRIDFHVASLRHWETTYLTDSLA